ncbi:unnamed protein product [Polarella glacialis]|uniref:J domain-containing protein n=1 Tax=Polarella glacialis TaxID=89957 RepID=A0A813HAC2_POLGL|nr:unnamed protein product [Polarella glacialis]CAE8709535.1 unnamed protein product [Polarella glacialis]
MSVSKICRRWQAWCFVFACCLGTSGSSAERARGSLLSFCSSQVFRLPIHAERSVSRDLAFGMRGRAAVRMAFPFGPATSSGGPNPYDVLEIRRGADTETLRSAFRGLAKVYHPDVPSTGDAAKFRLLLWASEELSSLEGQQRWGTSSADAEPQRSSQQRASDWFQNGQESESESERDFWDSELGRLMASERGKVQVSGDPLKPKRRGEKKSFDEAGRLWEARRARVSGRMAAAPDNLGMKCKYERWGQDHEPSKDRSRYKRKPRRNN